MRGKISFYGGKVLVENGFVVIRRFVNRRRNAFLDHEFPADDHEEIAKFIEHLAVGYGSYRPSQIEGSKRYEQLAAYRLWVKRIKRATGIVLRKPRLSWIYKDYVPPDILRSGPYGERIRTKRIAGIRSLKDLAACLREDLFVILEEEVGVLTDRGGGYLGSSPTLTPTKNLFRTRRPAFFTCENAERILARLREHLPECKWQAITVPHLAAKLLGQLLAV